MINVWRVGSTAAQLNARTRNAFPHGETSPPQEAFAGGIWPSPVYRQPIGRDNYARANQFDRFWAWARALTTTSLIGKVYDRDTMGAPGVSYTGLLPTRDMYYNILPAHEAGDIGTPSRLLSPKHYGGQVPLKKQRSARRPPPWSRGGRPNGILGG